MDLKTETPADNPAAEPEIPTVEPGTSAPAAVPGPEGAPVAEPASAAGAAAPDPVAVLEQEKKALHDRMLRIAADFENFKKRAKRDAEEAQQRAREQVLRELLPVADNLERAVAHATTADGGSIIEGVKLVLRQLAMGLERMEVRPVEAVGRQFDPAQHEAIQQVETESERAGTVVTELQRGYTIGGRLLRPALVVVAKAPAPKAADAGGDGTPPATEGGAVPAGGG